ncbi:MAG: alpha/beta hydrolase [Acidobacteriota bacterium]
MSLKILWFFLFLVVMAVAAKLLVTWLEPRLTFHPTRGLSTRPRGVDTRVRELEIETEDGETICVWSLERKNPLAEILFFHGNRGNLSLWSPLLSRMSAEGYSVAALDYRGYGTSSGSPTEAGLYRDTTAFVAYFWRHLNRSTAPVVYWGRSLGGVTGSFATTLRPPQGLILESTFPDKKTLMGHRRLLRWASLFSRYKLPVAEFLNGLSCPTLVIQGDSDPVVPLAVGRNLFERIPARKEFFLMAGAGHGDTHEVHPTLYWRRIRQFIETIRDG